MLFAVGSHPVVEREIVRLSGEVVGAVVELFGWWHADCGSASVGGVIVIASDPAACAGSYLHLSY